MSDFWPIVFRTAEKALAEGLTWEQALPLLREVSYREMAPAEVDEDEEEEIDEDDDEPRFNPDLVWGKIDKTDYLQAEHILAGWFFRGLKEVSDRDNINTIHIELGDCPEQFAMSAGMIDWDLSWDELLDNNHGLWEKLGDYVVDENNEDLEVFPFPELVSGNDMGMDFAYMFWLTFAMTTIAEEFKAAKSKWDVKPWVRNPNGLYITYGFEELVTCGGVITADGWIPKNAKKLIDWSTGNELA